MFDRFRKLVVSEFYRREKSHDRSSEMFEHSLGSTQDFGFVPIRKAHRKIRNRTGAMFFVESEADTAQPTSESVRSRDRQQLCQEKCD